MDEVVDGIKDVNMKDFLQEREEVRKEKIKNLKRDKELSGSNPGKVFEITFDTQIKAILDSIKTIEEENVDQNETIKHLNRVMDDVNSLSKYLSLSTNFLSNYNVKKGMNTIESVENQINYLQAKLLPKKKFGFKEKKRHDVNKRSKVKDEVDTPIKIHDKVNSADNKAISYAVISCGFSDKKNDFLKLSNDEIVKNHVELRNLDKCVVFLSGNPSTVHISNVTGCKILCGPVSTSVFIEDCTDSDVVVACQQLRIHSTKDSRFYIHVTSRAIIEDTHNIQFAPYNLEYEELEMHFENSGLCRNINNWNKIGDFNFLASNVQSPNWKLMNVEDRVLNWHSCINIKKKKL